jgi:glycosyltransferase involved in cell wall biosynthesis
VRIGLVVFGSLETVSGGYLYDRMVVEHLRRLGDQVEVISLPWRCYIRHLGDNLSLGLLRRLSCEGFDLLLQDELTHPSLFWMNQRLRRQARLPIVSVVHNLRCRELRPAWQNRLYRWIEWHYLKTQDGFVCNSRTTGAEIEALVREGGPKLLAYPGRDHLGVGLGRDEKISSACRPGPLRIIFVGNLIPHKGLHVLVSALKKLRRACFRLTVIGSMERDPGYVRRIRRQIHRTGLSEQVSLLGLLTSADVARHLAESHVLAVPSFYEGFGIVYMEAMAFGLPAIASSAGAAPEIIQDGREGFLVPPGDPAALARCLEELVEDRERLLAMGLAAKKRFTNHPTWAESAETIRSFLHGFLDRL